MRYEDPKHYCQMALEPIEYITANQMEFWRGNIIKYASRAGKKGDEAKDLRKIIRYAQFRINELEGRRPQNDNT